MEIKINAYYKNEIDKAKEGCIQADYTLKSPYFFIGLYVLCIIYEVTLLSKNLYICTILMYALPLITGCVFELYEMKKYGKLELGICKIKSILRLTVLRSTNICLFLTSLFLIAGQSLIPKFYNYADYIEKMNVLLIQIYIVIFLICMFLFKIGMILEKKQMKMNKVKKYYPVRVISSLAVMGVFILRQVTVSVFFVIGVFSIALISYSIGKIYFRYKYFDKMINPHDKLIRYQL